jgi:hypothetical protein
MAEIVCWIRKRRVFVVDDDDDDEEEEEDEGVGSQAGMYPVDR